MAKEIKQRKVKSRSVRVGVDFASDGRRKHRHWEVTIQYRDGKKFARVYTDRVRALRFAERQKKSPVVRSAKIREV